MGKWSVSIAWKFYLAYGIFMAAIGFLALVVPREIAVGEFESFTGTAWGEFTEANAKVGSFIEHVYRGLGCMALLAGIFNIFIAVHPYRRGEAWSWWAVLTVGIITWGSVFFDSVTIGDIGDDLVFNIIAALLFLVAIVLPAKAMLGRKS